MTAHESTTTRFEPKQTPCVVVEDLLPLYLEGEVSAGTRDLVANHLSDCEHCAGFLAGAQSVRAQLRQEQRTRSSVIADDQPAFKAITALQFALVLFGTLGAGVFLMLILGFTNSYGLRGLIGSAVPVGALALGGFALYMIAKQRGGKAAFNRMLTPGMLTAIGGLLALFVLTQLDLIVRIVEFFARNFLYTPLYMVAQLLPMLGALGIFGVFVVAVSALVVFALRRNGQSGTPE